MKEKWTNDLQKKMNGFEIPTIPEGLWENIDAALETGEQATNTQHLTPNTQHLIPITRYWRKASAAILLLLAIPTALYLLRNKENEIAVVELEKNAPLHEISSSKAKTPKDTEASPTLSTPSAKHIAKATIQKTTIAEAPIDNSSNSAIEEQRHKAEEVNKQRKKPPLHLQPQKALMKSRLTTMGKMTSLSTRNSRKTVSILQ